MTREKKIEWLEKATPEELMKRYELATLKLTQSMDEEFMDWQLLAREEILKRMSK